MSERQDEWRYVEDEEWRLAMQPRIHPHAYDVQANPSEADSSPIVCDDCGGPAFIPPDYAAHVIEGRLSCDRCWHARKESDAA
jgi:hypothetical protein